MDPPLLYSPPVAEPGLPLGLSLIGSRPFPYVTYQAWAPRKLQGMSEVPPPGAIAEVPLCHLPRPRWAEKAGAFRT